MSHPEREHLVRTANLCMKILFIIGRGGRKKQQRQIYLRVPSSNPFVLAKNLKEIHRAGFWCPNCLFQRTQDTFNIGETTNGCLRHA